MSTREQTTTAGGINRRTIATVPTYAEAERIVDRLSDRGFAVEHISIVGRDLRFVEKVTGRVGWGDAIVRGALAGGLAGLLVGWLFGLFDWFQPIVAASWLAFDGLWFGMLVGIVFGAIGHWLTRGRRDFDSVTAMTADRYEVLVDEQVADEAERLLADAPAPAADAPAPAPAEAGAGQPAG